MPLAERREPLDAEPYQSVLMGDDEPADLSQFDLLYEAIEVLTLVIQPATNLLNPLTWLVATSLAVVAQSGHLMRRVWVCPS